MLQEEEDIWAYNLNEKQKMTTYPPVNQKYEYLDHTEEVQLHPCGNTLKKSFKQWAMAMFGYMTSTESVNSLSNRRRKPGR